MSLKDLKVAQVFAKNCSRDVQYTLKYSSSSRVPRNFKFAGYSNEFSRKI
jgi:hypothetical protein